ncbi:MAG TPA: hypothetical protein VGD61_16890 [Pyrinomonadaceae bacterium]
MITDIFQKRYPNFFYFGHGQVNREIYVFLRQGTQIIIQDLRPTVPHIDTQCGTAYTKLVRELGYGIYSGDSENPAQICISALCEQFNWRITQGDAESFVSARFSLLELLFSEIERSLYKPTNSSKALNIFGRRKPQRAAEEERHKDLFRSAVHELNIRFREAEIHLQYHNGLFQYSSDKATGSQIDEPFWNLLKNQKWANVDIDVKEAIDRRDNNERDAAFYALKALESTIKIISDEKGWTRGTERGASSYIDNLVSSTNGRFIEPWEADQLKAIYRDLRNPHGHGPGSAPQPTWSYHQQNWLIECSMIWIKSLVNRM